MHSSCSGPFQRVGADRPVGLFRCSACGLLTDSDGRERHLSWHRGQAGELSPPVIEQRVGDLVRAARRLTAAYEAGTLAMYGSVYVADMRDALKAFHPDEVRP